MTDPYIHFSSKIKEKYKIMEWGHAIAILKGEFSAQFSDISSIMDKFELRRSSITIGGGGKSYVSGYLDQQFAELDWKEKSFDTFISIDGEKHKTPTHKVDCVKGRVALEIEWNNKTEFYDRDLNNFRLLHSLGAISVGVIITRATELQREVFKPLNIDKKYGASTTHLDRLVPKIEGGGAGGCPLLVIAINSGAYVKDS